MKFRSISCELMTSELIRESVNSTCLIIHLFAEVSKLKDDIVYVDIIRIMNCSLYVYENN